MINLQTNTVHICLLAQGYLIIERNVIYTSYWGTIDVINKTL